MPPPFKTTSELLAYAQENPQTLRDKWWEYYVAQNEEGCRRVTSIEKCIVNWSSEDKSPHGKTKIAFFEEAFTPIPCPHFIFRYTTNWLPLLDGLKLPPNEYHAHVFGIAAAQPKHSLTLCIQDAWKVDDIQFCIRIGDWIGVDVYDGLEATGYELFINKGLLHNYIEILIDKVFTPAIAHQKEAFLKEHRERGLLNKKLFNT